ncbi:uncharacterized protein LOC128867743 [Anastrepha ludens]|uniref:uncharacterized protein LOC128867743 n=1 Tax=Anastrepha ludens TaxID=28586 RepID=UPI0023B0F712|nr:uncharacterized protein LOC128867743 [Anastrepha ludens]
MHSSQLPVQKLPLTKGVTVNGLAKRLSMERFSPPPPLSGPAFSYIRPNEGIMYAQLDHNEEQNYRRESVHSPIRELRSPLREYRSPARDIRDLRSTEHDIPTSSMTMGRQSVDRTDFATSQNNMKNTYNYSNHNSRIGNSNGSRIIIEPSTRAHDTYGASVGAVGPTTIRITNSHSPSPWQQLSPRNLSDEDEGLGIETRKYYEDETPALTQSRSSKSPAEPPIVPVIRSITPTCENGYDARAYQSPVRDDPMDDIGYRRARLESRILTRRFGEPGTLERNGSNRVVSTSPERTLERNEYHRDTGVSPQRNRDVREESAHHRYLSPERERESYEPRFHKMETSEILNKYSPERSHLDIIAPTTAPLTTPTMEKTSRYKHTKYYDDGRGGVKEVYERETHLDAQGKPHVRETRHRERMDDSLERPQLQDYEPKSLDSQFTNTDQYRSSPENMKRYEANAAHPHDWHGSSLKRDKLQQRSFDKGDSGIENDFRKESFNGELISRWRKRTIADDIKACDTFLRKERRHIEQLHVARRKDSYVYRERSIDDGSHFDPHLDKYPTATSTLHRKDQQSQTAGNETLKRNKKLGGFEKVKQLFTGVSGGGGSGSGSEGGKSSKKDGDRQARANSSTTTVTTNSSAQTTRGARAAKDKDKDSNGSEKERERYMVKEEEMRLRYSEHRGAAGAVANTTTHVDAYREPKATDISMRRRLSTPKASPLLLKRTSSDKPKKESPLAKPEKVSWFKSLDRRSKSKSKEKLDVSVNGQSESSTMKRTKNSGRNTSAPPPIPPKNLRFFGDTDLDSNPPTITKANTTTKTRSSIPSTLNRSQKYSQSAYHLDRLNANPQQNDYRRSLSSATQTGVGGSRHKSSSMHNLENGVGVTGDEVDFRKRRHYSRSRDLDDISESGSETEDQNKRPNGGVGGARTLSRERLDRSHRYDDHTYRRSNDRHSTPLAMSTSTPNGIDAGGKERDVRRTPHHLMGPPKPARSAERRLTSSYSRERDRFPAESSGTEGESSLHSQRSVVYLHATTVGAIPQPYHLRRRSISRDDLRSNKGKPQPLQPMTRTVSRSVSMLAPWKPKLISEGYEINYSQEQNKRMATMPRKPHMNSSSTLTRTSKKSETPTGRTLRRHDHLKDDQSSLRHSSTTSASKSALSSNLRSGDGRRKIK